VLCDPTGYTVWVSPVSPGSAHDIIAARGFALIRLDREVERTTFAAQPEMLAELPGPVLMDEWQRWPESWDVVRRAVDDGSPRGRLLLAGSGERPSTRGRAASCHSGCDR